MTQKRKRNNGDSSTADSSSDAFPAAEKLLDFSKRTSLIVLSDSDDEPVVVAAAVGETRLSVPEPRLPSARQTRSPVLEQGVFGTPSSSFPAGNSNKRSRVSEKEASARVAAYRLQRSFSQPERKAKQRDSTDTIGAVLVQQVPETESIANVPLGNVDEPLPATASTNSALHKQATKLTRATSAKAATEADVLGSERQSYLQIFDRILHTVLREEAHLFSDQERQILSAFSDLDRHSRYLFTRVYMRKREWLRVSSLNYGEREVVEQSCKYLGAKKQDIEPFFLTEAEINDCEKALTLLLTPELRTLAKSKGIKQLSGRPKETLCSMIMKSTKQRTIVSFFKENKESTTQRVEELINEVVKITGPMICLNATAAELFERLHMVFFRSAVHINDDNTMRSAVLATIGQIRFPKYTIVRSSDIFVSAEHVIQYKALVEVSAAMAVLAASPVKQIDDHKQGWELYLTHRESWIKHIEYFRNNSTGDESGGTERSAIEYWKSHFTPGWALSRIVVRGAKFAATLKQYKSEEEILLSLLSQKVYQLHKRGEWYERLTLLYTTHLRPKRAKGNGEAQEQVLLLLKLGRETCIRAIQDSNVNSISLHAIFKQLRAIEGKLELEERFQYKHPRVSLEWRNAPERTVYGVRIKDRTRRGPSLWDGDDQVPCSVEELALWRYRSLGYHGLHSENAMATTLFSLLFWDIIFYPIPGVLDTEYQSRPLDMMSDAFYVSRKALIEQRLEQILAGEFLGAIESNYEAEFGAECVGVSWDITADNLLTVAQYMGGKGLEAICRVLAKEYRLKSSGFPDLCLWNKNTKKVMFVEVKSPKDKLSDMQRDWIDILLKNGIEVELCLVREGGKNGPAE
ncbi:hypothetical protein IW138_001279 [Coemansia sp. RSA 986]|nr:hypothetical protein IW138_001279 [Coemansia sp. RSA 986]